MRFLVVGDISVDLIYFLEHIPEPGETLTAQRALVRPGGSGATVAANLASLGNLTLLAARVGQDTFRAAALSVVEKSGVDLRLLQEDPEHTTSVNLLMLVPGGGRSMVASYGANRYLDASEFKLRQLDQTDAVVISAYALISGPQREYAIRVIAAAQKRGLPIFADLGSGAVQAVGWALLDPLRGADYLLMNQAELLSLTGTDSISEGIEALRQNGLERFVVKVGSMGSMVVTPDAEELVEPYHVDDFLDSTGAGDAHTAAFAHAIMSGADLIGAARIANLAGALATTEIGGQGRLVTLADLETLERPSRV